MPPCEGIAGVHVPEGCLIELKVAVYGLDTAPWEWRVTLTSYLSSIGFRKLLLEPCYWTKRAHGQLVAQVIIEVDDLWLGTVSSYTKWSHENLQGRFTFGKWRGDEAEFAGRRVRKEAHRIRIDQEKYILEELKTVPLDRGRRSLKHSPLTPSEFTLLRSGICRLNLVAKETRPEISGSASILASRLNEATIEDVLTHNKAVQLMRDTAAQYLTIWKHDLAQVVAVTDPPSRAIAPALGICVDVFSTRLHPTSGSDSRSVS